MAHAGQQTEVHTDGTTADRSSSRQTHPTTSTSTPPAATSQQANSPADPKPHPPNLTNHYR